MKIKPNITCADYESSTRKFCAHVLAPKLEGDKTLCAHPSHFLCTETLKYEPSRVSHSAIQDHMRCPKLDYLKNVCGLEAVEQLTSNAIKMGVRWEAYLEQRFTPWTGESSHKYTKVLQANPLPKKEDTIIEALAKAMNALELTIPQGVWQHKEVVGITDSDNVVHPVSFVFDVLHPDTKSFSEVKCTSQFKYYDNAWAMRGQAGLYLALNPELDYCTMYIVQKPDIKMGSLYAINKANETAEEYETRVYNLIIGDGKRFFLDMRGTLGDGSRTWGRRFDRAQFDLDDIRLRVIEVSKLRQRAMIQNYWMMNTQNCFMYGQDCEFLSVCKNHGRMDSRFRVKSTEINKAEEAQSNENESS